MLASTRHSTLPARPVTRYLPKAGTAPAQAFAVGRRNLTFARGERQLPVRVWYPASGTPGDDPANDAVPAAGAFPVVLFSHGLTSQPDDYAPMLARWAQAGLVVVGPHYPHTAGGVVAFSADDIVNQPADASYVLTQMLALDDPLSAHLDAARIGAAGHSGGGITTAGLFSSERDSRLSAGIILAGTDFRSAPFSGPAAAMLFVHGRQDGTVAYDAGHTVFKAVPWPRAMLTITAGGHVTTPADFETITGTSTDFLRWSLYGDAAAKARIPARAAVNGVATLENQL
jgi:fermentation-respiration switch protein FrsA (DUF1100 family)